MSHTLQGVELFKVGTWNGITFSEDDLDSMVASFSKLERASRVPLKLGHNDDQSVTDGQPALGWVSRVWRDGKSLFADFVDIPRVLFDAIGKKLYKQVSVELLKDYSQSGARFPWVLDAVALLGADIPAVKGLKDLNTLMMASALPGVRFAARTAFTSATSISGGKPSMSDEEIKALQARLDAAEKATREANERAEKVEKERFSEKVEARRKFIRETLESAVTEGRIQPRVRDRVIGSRQFKADADLLDYWTEDAVKAEISDNTRADFTERKGATSMASKGDEQDFTGMTNASVLSFKTQQECLRVGGKVDSFDDLNAAQARVLKADPKLARSYFSEPNGTFAVGGQ